MCPPHTGSTAMRLERHLDTQLERPRVGYCRRRVGRDDVLQVGLQHQPGVDLDQVGEFDRLFGVCHREFLRALRAHVMRPVARISETQSELVGGSAFEYAYRRQSSTKVGAEAVNPIVAQAGLQEAGHLALRLIRIPVEKLIGEYVESAASTMLHRLAVGLSLRKVVESRGVVPAADRGLRIVLAEHRLPSESPLSARWTRPPLRAIQEVDFRDDQRAIASLENAAAAVRSVDRDAVEHRDADDQAFRGLERDAHADGGVGKDRWPLHTTLRELRSDPERAVEEQPCRQQAIELAIEVVEAR